MFEISVVPVVQVSTIELSSWGKSVFPLFKLVCAKHHPAQWLSDHKNISVKCKGVHFGAGSYFLDPLSPRQCKTCLNPTRDTSVPSVSSAWWAWTVMGLYFCCLHPLSIPTHLSLQNYRGSWYLSTWKFCAEKTQPEVWTQDLPALPTAPPCRLFLNLFFFWI